MAKLEALASALSRNGFAVNKDEIRRAATGGEVKFRTFEELVAKKIQYGDLDEVKMLLELRAGDFQKDKIARLLNTQQKAKLEQLHKDTILKS